VAAAGAVVGSVWAAVSGTAAVVLAVAEPLVSVQDASAAEEVWPAAPMKVGVVVGTGWSPWATGFVQASPGCWDAEKPKEKK
jgi:hypothetical protein